MKSLDEIHAKENAIIEGERLPTNRGEVQMHLATKLFEYLFGEGEGSHNGAMEYWVEGDNEGYSSKFAELEKDPLFKTHPRLLGDIFKITVEDMIQYKREGSLPA